MARNKTRRPQSPAQRRWATSAEFATIALKGIRRSHELQKLAPKCGAKCRSGDTCRNLPMANGRCRMHGGLTPKGDRWHKVTFNPTTDPAKLEKKLAEVAKRRKQQRVRLAKMTPEERAAYEIWQKKYKATSATDRARTRQAGEAREFLQAAAFERAEQESARRAEDERIMEAARRRLQESRRNTTDEEGDVFE